MENNKSVRLTESAIMLAFGTILSMIALVKLPYGGSITACSMLPVILISYRRGIKWGLFTALAYSLLQLILDLNTLSYATSLQAAIAIILLDFVAAFTMLGFGGIFRNLFKTQAAGLTAGVILVSVLRYICHVISGCTVWAGVSIPDSEGLLYSLAYNATYMLPEMLVTIAGAVYLSRVLDFRSESITRALPQAKMPDLALAFTYLARTLAAAAVLFDIQQVFSKIQGESGFDITQLSAVHWNGIILVTLIAVALAVVFTLLARKVPSDSTLNLQPLFKTLPVLILLAAAVFVVVLAVRLVQEGSAALADWVQIAILALAVAAAAFIVLGHRKKARSSSHA